MVPTRLPSGRLKKTQILPWLIWIMFIDFKPAAAQTNCVPYYSEETEPIARQQRLRCSAWFSQCDCVSIQSSNGGTELTLSEAENQLDHIINQAEVFSVSSTCRNSFVSLYCHQVYVLYEGTTANSLTGRPVCPEDCKAVISNDCRDDWTILSNIIAQFIERGTIQLPSLRQLEECGGSELDATTGDNRMEGNKSLPCISLQTPSPLNTDCLNTQRTSTQDKGGNISIPLILGVSMGVGVPALILLVVTLCFILVVCLCQQKCKDSDDEKVKYYKNGYFGATNPAIELEYVDIESNNPGSSTTVDRKDIKSNGTLMLRSSMLQGVFLNVNLSPRTRTLTRHIGTKDFAKMSPKQRLQCLEFPHDNICLMKNLSETNFGWTRLGEATGIFENEISSTVFIKSLREHASSKLKEQFRIEMTWVSGFSHPNVIQLLAVCTRDQPQYMIYEYLEYGSLKEFLQSMDSVWDDFDTALNDSDAVSTGASSRPGPALGLEDLVNISWQVANGMDYLTKKAFILKDLATRNCQIGQGLQVKIANFGLSYDKHSTDYCCLSSRKSTPLPLRWLAPETIQHNKMSVYTDIWSFGVLLWEVFSSGRRPYGDLSNAQVVQHVLGYKLLPKPENCPKAAYNLMLRCWNREPLQRPWFSTVMEELKQLMSNLDPEDIKLLEASPRTPSFLRRI